MRYYLILFIGFISGLSSTCPVFSETHFDAFDTRDPVTAYRLPLVVLPFLNSAPEIDGDLGMEEWENAALLSGLHTQAGYLGGSGLLHDDGALVHIGYDSSAIYIAFETERPLNARKPKANFVPGDDPLQEKDLWKDDRLEILVQTSQGTHYHFAVNAAGHRGDGLLISSTDHSWNGRWQANAKLTQKGWQCEVRLPFKMFGTDFPGSEDIWRLLLMRARRTPEKSLSTISYLTSWANSQEYARVRFGSPETPSIHIPRFGVLERDHVGLEIEIHNPIKDSELLIEAAIYRKRDDLVTFTGENKLDKDEGILIPVTIDWAFYQEFLPNGWQAALDTAVQLKDWSEKVVIPAGSSWSSKWALEGAEGQYLCTYTIKDASSGEILAARAMPFQKKNSLRMKIEPWVLMNDEIRVTVQYDYELVGDSGAFLKLYVRDADSHEVFFKKAEIDLKMLQNLFIFPAKDNLGKTLKFEAFLQGTDGETVSSISKSFDIPEIPEWLGNDYGMGNEVPAPWRPIRMEGNRADVLLRDYHMGSNGLPEQIWSLGTPLLAGPIHLKIENVKPEWNTRIINCKSASVVWESTCSLPDFDIRLLSTLEYDGMIRCDLTLIPHVEGAAVRDLELIIPYRKDRNIEKLPIVRTEFQPLVQLGDYETGLCWAAEWCKEWQIGQKPLIEIRTKEDIIDWRTRFVGIEGRILVRPVTFTWILEALPVKAWNTEYRDKRVVKYLGSEENYNSPGCLPESMTENSLRYPLGKNLPADSGSLSFHYLPGDTLNVPRIRLFEMSSNSKDLSLYHERLKRPGDRWPYKQSMVLYHGKREVARIFPVMRQLDTPWLAAGLSWSTVGENIHIDLFTFNSKEAVISAQASITKVEWHQLLSSGMLIFGGERTLGLDDICVRSTPLDSRSFALNSRSSATPDPTVRLLDNLDRIVFWQGRFRTLPTKIAEGEYGLAGAKYASTFMQKIDGRFNQGLLLPAGVQRTTYDYAESLGCEMFFPNQGQWQAMCGYYSPTFVEDPVLQSRWNNLRRRGFGIIAYTGFAFDPEFDPMIGPYMDELSRVPVVKIYTGHIPCRATPAVDYYTWGLRNAIDYYGIQGLHLDATWDCKSECTGEACGCRWEDDKGAVRGRYTIFANRKMAQRFYRLMKTYRHELYGLPGYIGLHSGASEFPMVSAYADVCKHGEGGQFSTSDFAENPILPEDFDLLVSSRRAGVPVEILTKDSNMPYGPNYLYLYTLLFDMGLRTKNFHLFPEFWHMDSQNPNQVPEANDFERSVLGEFNPYGAHPGISSYPLPTALLWMLMDDFDCQDSRFLPFWETSGLVTADRERIRCSAWLHPRNAALIALCGFTGKPERVALRVDWLGLGIDSENVEIFDALTGEEFERSAAGIHVFLDKGPYRLIRIESAAP